MSVKIEKTLTVPAHLAGVRLDQALAALLGEYSRARLTQWIKTGAVLLNDHAVKPKTQVAADDTIRVVAEVSQANPWRAEDLPLSVVFEDEALLVINKPAGLVVHPAAGNWQGTLLNALLYHHPELVNVPRAGIVHRLDKDTTGLLLVAKTVIAHHALVRALQAREITRDYQAIVYGEMTGGGTVDAPIGRHPRVRTKMAVRQTGKPAVTHYRLQTRLAGCSHLSVTLATGRTHQIRVHLAHLNHPLIGDPSYTGRIQGVKGLTPAQLLAVRTFPRQALHAWQLQLNHPLTGELLKWQAALPEDMQGLLDVLLKG